MTDTRITAKLIEKIKRLVSTGVIVPGAKFPPERELAREFNGNRSTLHLYAGIQRHDAEEARRRMLDHIIETKSLLNRKAASAAP